MSRTDPKSLTASILWLTRKGRYFSRFLLSQLRAEPVGAPRQVVGILKTLDTGRYDDKNGLNKVRNETMLLERMPGLCVAKRTEEIDAGMGWMAERAVG